MNKTEIRDFFKKRIGVEITDDMMISKDEYLRFLNRKDLENIVSIFRIWDSYIPTDSYPTFISKLLNNLSTLHCCAVSSNPGSPCYIRHLSLSKLLCPLPKDELYTACRLHARSLIRGVYSAGVEL